MRPRKDFMTTRKNPVIVFALLLGLVLLSPGLAYSAANKADCEALKTYVEGLTDEAFEKQITNVTATWKTATGGYPEYCEVKGRIFPETDFAEEP